MFSFSRPRALVSLAMVLALVAAASPALAHHRWNHRQGQTATCASNQFRAEYFNNTTLSGTPVLTRCESTVNYDWGRGGPGSGVATDNFSVRWSGVFGFTGGDYRFDATTDDGMRVSIDGTSVIDAWKTQAATSYSGQKTITAGDHTVKVEYYEAGYDAVAKASWTLLAPQPQPSPTASPSPTTTTCSSGQFRAEYFNNTTLSGTPTLTRCESSVNYDWGLGGPGSGVATDNFSVRWSGTFAFTASDYAFTATTDDGMRVWVDGSLIIDGWKQQAATTYSSTRALTAGDHEVKVEYYEAGNDAVAKASWVLQTPQPQPSPTPSPSPTGGSTESYGPIAMSCNGVDILPGQSIQNAVNNNPGLTTFCIRQGVHKRQQVQPKSGNIFIGELGAVLDGENAVSHAFTGGSGTSNVIIKNLVIERYANPSKGAAVERGSTSSSNWLVEHNEIRNNSEVGVRMASRWIVRSNFIHHNGRYGVNGSGSDLLFEHNELSYNANIYGGSGESSGSKWVFTKNMVIRDNYVHDNRGNGLWTDISNIGTLIEDNLVVNHEWTAIFHEISCAAVIRNNHIENAGFNGKNSPTWVAGGNAISVANSPDVEIYGNTILGSARGIGGVDWNHPNLAAVTDCTPRLKNMYVHDNFTAAQGDKIAAGLSGSNEVHDTFNNRFRNNSYSIDSQVRFAWKGMAITYSEWKSLGNDV